MTEIHKKFPRSGFSFIELLIVLSLITITASLTIPSYKNFFTTTSNQTIHAQLQHAINLARSEAMLRGVTISLCGTRDHLSCDDVWQHGAMLFIDETDDGIPANKSDVLYVFNHNIKTGNLFWRSSFNVNYMQVAPAGTTNGEDGKFWFCPRDAKQADWALTVSETGRTRELTDPAELQKLPCA